MSSRWRQATLALAATVVRDGLNHVVVQWPPLEDGGVVTVDMAADRFLAGAIPELYPVFGEIHSFTASLTRQDTPACADRQQDERARDAQATVVGA